MIFFSVFTIDKCLNVRLYITIVNVKALLSPKTWHFVALTYDGDSSLGTIFVDSIFGYSSDGVDYQVFCKINLKQLYICFQGMNKRKYII